MSAHYSHHVKPVDDDDDDDDDDADNEPRTVDSQYGTQDMYT